MQTKALNFGWVLLSFLLAHQLSYADGYFIPPVKKKIPDIPVQRALVNYHAGVETLVVESTLDGQGGDYGWIIPVPSPPTKFDKVSPGLLKTLSLQIQPNIQHTGRHMRKSEVLRWGIFTMLIVGMCFGIMRWGAKGCIIPGTLLGFVIYMFPNFTEYRDGPDSLSIARPSVKITGNAIVGDYDVLVLEAQDSSVLNTWLGNNGFSPFSPEAAPIIDDYIAQGWVFAVAKLRTISDGLTTPHPILLEFETDQPVYPMKLTGIPGSTLYLELYIVGANEAIPVNYNLEKEYCNFYDHGKIPDYRFNPSDGRKVFIPRKLSWKSIYPYMEIAHPDAIKVMWDGCVVTKLAGKVNSDEMMNDMFFRFKAAKPFRSVLYTSEAAYYDAYYTMLVFFFFGSIFFMIFYYVLKGRGAKVSIMKLFIILLMLGAAMFEWRYLAIGEKAEVYTLEPYWYDNFSANLTYPLFYPKNRFSNGTEVVVSLQREGIDNPITHESIIIERSPGNFVIEETGPEDRFSYEAELVESLQRKGIDNPITHEPIIIEHSPGNIVVEETGNGIWVRICLENGSLH